MADQAPALEAPVLKAKTIADGEMSEDKTVALTSKVVSVNEAETSRSFRGPLRYEVEASSPQLEAGKPFSVFVRITNPYDVPVIVQQVKTQLPIEFVDPDQDQVGFFRSVKQSFKEGLNENLEQKARKNVVNAVSVSPGIQSGNEDDPEFLLLQPGNTGLKKFTVSTKRKTFFAPATYNLQIQITYKIDENVNSDAIKQQMNIRAPLSALIWGSVWGAITGSMLRSVYSGSEASLLVFDAKLWGAILGSIILAGVLIVAFARKKDVQPFISVEDFWGGFFIGVVAGYVGKPLLDKFIVLNQSGATSTKS